VPELIEKYLADGNLLKTLQLTKDIGFDFGTLHSLVKGYVRSLGWRRGLEVSFPKANYTVRTWSSNTCVPPMPTSAHPPLPPSLSHAHVLTLTYSLLPPAVFAL
jgi:hypothetical protein